MKELLFFKTIRKDAVWGSEYWTVSAHQNGDCEVSEGTYKGEKLSSLWRDHRELFGDIDLAQFPLLVKVIDAKKDLSIQVHPNDEYARINENGSLGKTECWYILNSSDDEKIVLGHNAKSRAQAQDMIKAGKWNELLRKIPISEGNFVLINPGTIHSILGGTELLEIQQSSDITYRLYDYDRIVEGKKRELHIEKSLDVIEIPDGSDSRFHDSFPEGGFQNSCFRIEKDLIEGEKERSFEGDFAIISVVEGEGTIDGHKISRGDSFLVPAKYGKAIFKGKMDILITSL